uniref:Uncharacterized protein n=1 Tax=Anguilla anguilla TaxID=7936 RepID=A0A0E9QUB5_ANGAN
MKYKATIQESRILLSN